MPDPEVEALANATQRLADGLAAGGHDGWSAWLTRDAARIRGGDGHGVSHLLAAFGGMGSLSDLVLDPPLERLRSDVYARAQALRAEAEP